MAEKRWEFELDGVRHTVELEHNAFSNKQFLRVDGRLSSAPLEVPQQGDGRRHAFRIDGHACEVVVANRDRKFHYDFLIDGVPDTPEIYSLEFTQAQTSPEVKGTARVIGGLFLLIGLGGNLLNWYWAHTGGSYLEELALLAPTIGFIGLYFVLFPKDFAAQYSGRFSLRMWIAIILAFLLGFANMYAFSHGLY